MNDDPNSSLARRSILRRLGAGSLVAVGGSGTVSGRDPAPGHLIEPGTTFEPDIGDLPGIRTAELTVHEASISTHVRLDAETLASKDSEADGSRLEARSDGAANGVRLRLDPDELPRPENVGNVGNAGKVGHPGRGGNATPPRVRTHTEREIDGDLLQVAQSRRSGGDLTTHSHFDGMNAEPSLGSRDVAVYGQTESQECGPLARTAVVADRTSSGYIYNETADRESVDGNACRGHEWDGKFEAFCDYLGWIPGYDCGVPRVFDTSWHVEGTGFDSAGAQTVYACYDFPAVPDTVVVAQDVGIDDGPSVEYSAAIGVSTEDDISDYDWDSNGIANLVVDGIDAALGTGRWSQAFTLAVSAYLLEQDQGIVS